MPEYVVLVGNDDVIPFFRYPDQSQLGPAENYDPPVADGTISQASLRLNYVLSQDANRAMIDETLPKILGVVLILVSITVLARVLRILKVRERDGLPQIG